MVAVKELKDPEVAVVCRLEPVVEDLSITLELEYTDDKAEVDEG